MSRLRSIFTLAFLIGISCGIVAYGFTLFQDWRRSKVAQLQDLTPHFVSVCKLYFAGDRPRQVTIVVSGVVEP